MITMSENEEKSAEEIKKELAFYRNQTQVLREKNRDLRNALLLAESQEGVEAPKETAEDSLSDIRKIISDSKKQISEKLTQFKEDLDKSDTPPTATTSAPKTNVSTLVSAEADVLNRQCDYLKEEVERLENFLEQSEMVNNRLRDLLTKHNIDVSEISQAINEASKTAVSQKAVAPPVVSEPVIPEPVIRQPVKETIKEKAASVVETPKTVEKQSETKRELSPEVAKLFKDLRAKLSSGIGDEDIKMEILNFREKLMDLIPHSRVFYEMQVEYRRWKRGTSSVKQLQDVMNEWEKTIASM
jgi:hypothetical protein